MMKVELIRRMKDERSIPYVTGADIADVNYPTFMRWNRRYKSGKALVSVPGPKKIERLELGSLMGGHLPPRVRSEEDFRNRKPPSEIS